MVGYEHLYSKIKFIDGSEPIPDPTYINGSGVLTGDLMFMIIATILLIGLCAVAIYFFNTKKVFALNYGKTKMAKHAVQKNHNSKIAWTTMAIIAMVVAFSVAAISANHKAIADNEDQCVSGPDTILAKVDPDTGKVTIEDATFQNTADHYVNFTGSTILKIDGIDDEEATWTIKAFDKTVYNDQSKETEGYTQIVPWIYINEFQTFVIKYSVDIDPELAKSFIDKEVVTSCLEFNHNFDGYKVTADLNGGKVDGDAPFNWTGTGSIYTKTIKDGTEMDNVIKEWADTKIIKSGYTLVGWDKNSEVVKYQSKITAKWEEGRLLIGQIFDSNGQPANNATIMIFNNEGNLITSGLTDENGNYKVKIDADQSGYAKVIKEDSTTGKAFVSKDVSFDKDSKNIDDCVISPAVKASGTITDNNGDPVEGVNVTFTYENEEGEIESFKTYTDENGNYSLFIKKGTQQNPLNYRYNFYKKDAVNHSNFVSVDDSDTIEISYQSKGEFINITVDFGKAVPSQDTIPEMWTKTNEGNKYVKEYEAYLDSKVVSDEWKHVEFVSGKSSTVAFGGFDVLEQLITENKTLNAKWVPVQKDALFKYTLDELKAISDNLANLGASSIYWHEFNYYMNHAFYYDEAKQAYTGSDNGVTMKDDPNRDNHWAFDKYGNIFSEPSFQNDDPNTIVCRLVGINQDKYEDGRPIGLTFMLTHRIGNASTYDFKYHSESASYGWGGSSENGQSYIQALLNPNEASQSLLPSALYVSLPSTLKTYGVSTGKGYGKTYDVENKVWLPSFYELTGFTKEQYPAYEKEGPHYSAFAAVGYSTSFKAPMIGISDNWDASSTSEYIMTRSLVSGNPDRVHGISGNTGSPSSELFVAPTEPYCAVAPCFSIGTPRARNTVTFGETKGGAVYEDKAGSIKADTAKIYYQSAIATGKTEDGINYIQFKKDGYETKTYYAIEDSVQFKFTEWEGIPETQQITEDTTISPKFIDTGLALHDKLNEYTLFELDTCAKYLADESHCVEGDPYYDLFKGFMEKGITSTGSDNGTPKIEDNHWAIDYSGKTYTEEGFNQSNCIEVRIIGIHHDYTDTARTNYAGLTFMATHSITTSIYNDGGTSPWGWNGNDSTGKSTLQNNVENLSFPNALSEKIKTVKKISLVPEPLATSLITTDNKIWCPSYYELTGETTFDDPSLNLEGKQYAAFKNIGYSSTKYAAAKRLAYSQSGSRVADMLFFRTMYTKDQTKCRIVNSLNGTPTMSLLVSQQAAICPCFCL